MAVYVIMPRQGNTVESCIVAKWHKKKGDKVKAGDLLFTYETDKATFDEESAVDGTILEIFYQEGDDVPVLKNMCAIGEEGEKIENIQQQAESAGAGKESAVVKAVKEEKKIGDADVKAAENSGSADFIKISPRARNLAEKSGINPAYAAPTGPSGRILERDIKELSQNGKATGAAREAYKNIGRPIEGTGIGGRITTGDVEAASVKEENVSYDRSGKGAYEEVKLTNIRKMIASAMHDSLSRMAQLTLNTSFDASELLNYREKIKAGMEKLNTPNITINDFILYAVSRVLKNHRDINAHFLEDRMHLYNTVNLGVAVDTERGLMVPTIFNADRKSLSEISLEVRDLASKCREGKINPDYLTGGTFTVTNLGVLGVESFTPVINPPQTAILGVDCMIDRIRNVKGEIKSYPAMGLSLTFDHRAVDGAPAAKFLKELCMKLENFTLMLAD